MQRIRKLTLKNFKFFYGEEVLDFERKNVLLYGENGSGKSSIYWALYAFLQSVFKTNDAEIKKYFNPDNEQNLINRFAEENVESAIIVEFEDDHESTSTRKISKGTINTKSGNLVKVAAQASDFINYRLLSKVYDFSNRDSIDLFPLFERELLMFIKFTTEFKPGNSNAHDWWEYLKPGLNPRPKMHEQAYKDFVFAVNEFNKEFEAFLNRIVESANEYLQQKFKQKLKLQFQYHPASYDAFIEGSTTKRNRKTLPPKIILSVSYLHDQLHQVKQGIKRAHTFLNEARLTTIALSIRFAMLDEKYITDATKLLVMDDLLISLDMSNRDIVLELILNEFSQYQILIMTHDRAYFNLARKRLEYEGCREKWVIKEIYYDEDENGIPRPFIPDNKDYLQRAEKYLREFDYPACANYLRKEAEHRLKYLLPYHTTISINLDEGSKACKLEGLLGNFKSYYEGMGGDFTPFKKLKEYKDILLNPLSHDNIDTPIYKQELLSLKSALINLRKLDSKILVSIKEKEEIFIYLTESDKDSNFWEYKIQLKEYLKAFKLLDGTWKLSNPNCLFVHQKNLTDNSISVLNRNQKLNKGYDEIRHSQGIKSTEPPKDLFEIVKNDKGQKLKELL